MSDEDANYYLITALQSLKAAYSANHDLTVATYLSQAMDVMHRMTEQADKSGLSGYQVANDPYEMDESNSAV